MRESGKTIHWLALAAVGIPIALTIVFVWRGISEEEPPPYGFSGSIYKVGVIGHEVYFSQGVAVEALMSIGNYLSRIGYFEPYRGGIIQVEATDHGYKVWLTYSLEHWEKTEFAEEVAGIGHDLETFVFKQPVVVLAVDEDEAGLHSEQFYP